MPARIARLAGLGAFGASAGLAALYLFLIYISRPQMRGGIDVVTATVGWIALGGVFAALIIVHVIIGRQLLLLARGPGKRHPL